MDYRKQDKKIRAYTEAMLSGVGDRVSKQEFFRNRKFILSTLTPKSADIFSLYYGLNDGNFKTYEQIASKYNCSRQNIGQELNKILDQLKQGLKFELLVNLTDKDLNCNESEYQSIDFEKVLQEKQLQEVEAQYTTHPNQSSIYKYLLEMTIEELDLSTRVYNLFYKKGMKTVEDIIKLSEDELKSIKNLGANGINEVISKINSLGLDFCPSKIEPSRWIQFVRKMDNFTQEEYRKFIKENKGQQLVNEEDTKFDINEIPKKYRKTYAVGAMVEAQNKQNKLSANERLSSTKIQSNKTKLPKIKLSKDKINQLEDNQLLDAVKDNVEIIKDLETSFIVDYKQELITLILNSTSISAEDRLDLIEIVNNANTFTV